MRHDKDTRELFIYEDIGPGSYGLMDAEAVKYSLSQLGSGDINLRVNSYGGSVDQALAMIEVLNRHNGQVRVSIDSIAASAASLFGVAFPSTIASHGRVMIHDPWTFAMGNAAAMRKSADILDKYGESIVTVYAAGMKHDTETIKSMMAEETWFSAAEAVEAGLADSMTEPQKKVAAKAFDPERHKFKNAPADLVPVEAKQAASVFENSVAAARLAILRKRIEARTLRG